MNSPWAIRAARWVMSDDRCERARGQPVAERRGRRQTADPDAQEHPGQSRQMGIDLIPKDADEHGEAFQSPCGSGAPRPAPDGRRPTTVTRGACPARAALDDVGRYQGGRADQGGRRQVEPPVRVEDLHELVGVLAPGERVHWQLVQVDRGSVGRRAQFGGRDGPHLEIEIAIEIGGERGVHRQCWRRPGGDRSRAVHHSVSFVRNVLRRGQRIMRHPPGSSGCSRARARCECGGAGAARLQLPPDVADIDVRQV